MVIKCLCFDGVKKTVKIVRFVLESCTFRFRDYKGAGGEGEAC